MRYCDQCGSSLKDNAKFCHACGMPISAAEQAKAKMCTHCGEQIENGNAFCTNCGADIDKQRNMQPQIHDKFEYTLEYLNRVAMLEKSVYTQNTTIDQMSETIKSLGHSINYEIPPKPQNKETTGDDIEDILSASVIAAVICGFVGMFTGNIIGSAIIGAGIIFIVLLLAGIISNAKENKTRRDSYNMQIGYYNNAVAEDEKRVKKEKVEAKTLSKILHHIQLLCNMFVI